MGRNWSEKTCRSNVREAQLRDWNAGESAGDNGTRVMMETNILVIQPIVALVAGILILVWPQILNYVIAAFLIITGILGLMHHM